MVRAPVLVSATRPGVDGASLIYSRKKTIVGTGAAGYKGDRIAATSEQLFYPRHCCRYSKEISISRTTAINASRSERDHRPHQHDRRNRSRGIQQRWNSGDRGPKFGLQPESLWTFREMSTSFKGPASQDETKDCKDEVKSANRHWLCRWVQELMTKH